MVGEEPYPIIHVANFLCMMCTVAYPLKVPLFGIANSLSSNTLSVPFRGCQPTSLEFSLARGFVTSKGEM